MISVGRAKAYVVKGKSPKKTCLPKAVYLGAFENIGATVTLKRCVALLIL